MKRLAILLAVVSTLWGGPALADSQNDGGSGGDAGNTFEAATPIAPHGLYFGRLGDAGDEHDYYKFFLPEGASVGVTVHAMGLVTLLDPNGVPVDAGAGVGFGVSPGSFLTADTSSVRVAVHRAIVAGDYRLHLEGMASYRFCFMNCEGPVDAPVDFIFGGSIKDTRTRVLLVPPAHGDLGNPFGPTVLDYLEATLRGVHRWTAAMDAFAADYPQFAYLRQIEVGVEVFDGVRPVDPAGYDMIIGYVAAGPVFRGVASESDFGLTESILHDLGLGRDVHFSGRMIALSLFGGSPRAGQVLYDFPEASDLEIVTMHEFAHTFGLGHTRTWHPVLGPDLMNSPAPFVYGDGFPAGDGGERTAVKCPSSLDLYGLAVLYRWVPTGEWEPTYDRTALPGGMPYKLYC